MGVRWFGVDCWFGVGFSQFLAWKSADKFGALALPGSRSFD